MFHFVCNRKLLFDFVTELFSRVIHSLDVSIHQALREIHTEENSRNVDGEMCQLIQGGLFLFFLQIIEKILSSLCVCVKLMPKLQFVLRDQVSGNSCFLLCQVLGM